MGTIRLELEAEMAHAALRQSQAQIERLHEGLARRLGLDPKTTHFAAQLTPTSAVEPRHTERPSLQALRHAEGHSRAAKQASRRSWLPDLSLSAAAETGGNTPGELGATVALSVALPLFDRGQARRSQAAAQVLLASAEVRAIQRADTLALRHAQQALQTARGELVLFDQRTDERLRRLAQASRSAGREGLLSPIQLLEAERGQNDVKMRRLEIIMQLKLSEIALRAASGEFE
jgi:cobalt-zinc-cadmium efflux system outer membrane protein